eukprot:1127415-Rhodomonas_salina.3
MDAMDAMCYSQANSMYAMHVMNALLLRKGCDVTSTGLICVCNAIPGTEPAYGARRVPQEVVKYALAMRGTNSCMVLCQATAATTTGSRHPYPPTPLLRDLKY